MDQAVKANNPYPVISIVGRPNVGKSTLFNRIVGRRQSIVQEESGTTRDRVFSIVEWEGTIFNLVDTGGLHLKSKELMVNFIEREVEKALEESEVVIMVTDGRSGVSALDEEVSEKIRRLKKNLILAVNKVDIESGRYELAEFYKLGLGEPTPISALHGLGIGELMSRVTQKLPKAKESPLSPSFTLSIVGEPNAGKSTLLNAYLKEDRAIVSDVAGTTRDSVEEMLHYKNHYIRIIDTAGIRHERKIKDVSTYFSLSRARHSITRSDVTFLLFEALKGIRRDTKAIASFLEKARKPVILVANKWDLTKGIEQARYERDLKSDLGFLKFAPVVFISAQNKKNLSKLLDDAFKLWKQSTHYIPTSELNRFMITLKRRRLPTPQIRLKFLTQTSAVPPEFVCFVKGKKYIPANYRQHFKNEIIRRFNLEGIPVKIQFKEEEEK